MMDAIISPPGEPMKRKRLLPLKVMIPLVLGIVISLTLLVFSEVGSRRLDEANTAHSDALRTLAQLQNILTLVVDAETGQRGYMLTGVPEYLEPYRAAVPKIDAAITALRALVRDEKSPAVRDAVQRINKLAGQRIGEMEATVALYDKSGRDVAYELMNTGLGKRTMDSLRSEIAALGEIQQQVASATSARWVRDVDFIRLSMQLMTASTVALLLVVWSLARRELMAREEIRSRLATERERLEGDVLERTAELGELSTHLQTVREEEKARLARDIHDELGGILVSAKMDVSAADKRLGDRDAVVREKLQRALASLDEGVAIKRKIIEDLRPTLLDNLGLAAALDWQAREVCSRAGLACELNLCEETSDLAPEVTIALYRIVQEALTNIVKYARAKKVSVDLMRDDEGIALVVADDGIGLPEKATHDRLSHGIIGMRQRVRALNGEFSIRGRPREGTQIEVRVPAARARTPDLEATV